ncbi:unnamed protein product [Rotaria sp. Silwood1]|nr:unnamed protein product [Rotaria sp. Silwood1]CAF1595670.1 unnamed protein product [Rotaria sp. Silwood1]CAF4792768.1 unnamed protein product [Rotaria sp. Silwood1]
MAVPSKQLLLNVAVSVAGSFHNRTFGLLGTYDGFGVTWAIDPSSSLFYYEPSQSAQFFEQQNRNFIPPFTDPTSTNNTSISTLNSCKINRTSSPSSWTFCRTNMLL